MVTGGKKGNREGGIHCICLFPENIGFSRVGDNRWITQYEALLCVLNSKGQVVTWRLTQGLSFDEIKADLISLKKRLNSKGMSLKEFYIDNCCSWRKKLQQVFGTELTYIPCSKVVQRQNS